MSLPIKYICEKCGKQNSCNNYPTRDAKEVTIEEIKATCRTNNPALDGNVSYGDYCIVERSNEDVKFIVEWLSCNAVETFLDEHKVEHHHVQIEESRYG